MSLANPNAVPNELELMARERANMPTAADAQRYAAAARCPSNEGVPQIPPEFLRAARLAAGLPPGTDAPAPQAEGPVGDAGPAPSKGFKTPQPSAAPLPVYQAHATVTLEWDAPDGVRRTESHPIRILNRDDLVNVAIMAGTMVRARGGSFDDLPYEDQAVVRSIALAEYLWPKMSSHLRAHLHNDDGFALDISAVMARHRATYFRLIDREGHPTSRVSDVRLVPGVDPLPASK